MSFHASLQDALAAQTSNYNNNNNNNNNRTNLNINHTLRMAALMTRPTVAQSSAASHATVPLPQRSIVRAIQRNWPCNKKQQLSQVFIKLRRNSIFESWGIVFSKFDNRLVLGDIKPKAHQCVVWSTVVAGSDLLETQRAFATFQNPSVRDATNLRTSAYAHAMSLPSWQVSKQLMPGDLLVSVDGLDPMSWLTVDGVTAYLRQATELSLVVLRHPQVTMASLACYNSQALNQSALGLTTAADHIWRSLLFPTTSTQRVATNQHRPNMAPIVRQVTPDDQTLSSTHNSLTSKPTAPVSSSYTAAKQIPNPLKKTATTSTTTTTSEHVYHGWRNSWFQDARGAPIPFDDNWEYSPEEGTRAKLFLPPITDFSTWLQTRKASWRTKYKVYEVKNQRWENGEEVDDEEDPCDRSTSSVAYDFWTLQGFASFEAWLQRRKEGWRTNYKVYRSKKRKIHEECEEVVHLDEGNFDHWLRIRKNQWKLHRRKRQRLRQIRAAANTTTSEEVSLLKPAAVVTPEHVDSKEEEIKPAIKRRRLFAAPAADIDMACIDDILAEEEARRKKLAERPPIDISFLFDGSKMAPDDVVIHILGFLDRKEHGKLLCINKEHSEQLKERNDVWRRLCPTHWILPRRPRKAWHEIYIDRLRKEQHDHQKRWDDLLVKCYDTICKGDQINKIEKLVAKGEKDFGFHINYVSPVVCERNCLLNLAVIHRRHKIVRWLVDQKGAQIESYDRGQFTPLLNAAWSGDKPMVRLLLQRGADRTKIGFFHYSKPVSSPDFQGLTAEGWARKKGFDDIAKLLQLGL